MAWGGGGVSSLVAEIGERTEEFARPLRGGRRAGGRGQVRARNLKVFFATCFESDEFEGLARFAGRRVVCAQVGDEGLGCTFTPPP